MSILQQGLLNIVLNKFDKKSEAVSFLTSLLDISADGVYRRLRGDTILSPEEITILALEFKISVDNLINNNDENLIFSFNAFDQPVTGFEVYIDQLLYTAKEIQKIENVELYYAVQELSIFFLASFPRIFAFRMFIYGLTYWKFDELQDKNFNPDLVPEQVIEKAKEVVNIYNSIPSHELWDLSLIDNTLNQIEYLATIDRFESIDQIRVLCDDLLEVIAYLRSMAKQGKKHPLDGNPNTNPAAFDLYYNEFASTNDSLLISSPELKILFTSFGSPDFLRTQNQKFCKHLEDWFKTIISRSTSISSHSERKRDWFFKHLDKKIRNTLEKIEILYDY